MQAPQLFKFQLDTQNTKGVEDRATTNKSSGLSGTRVLSHTLSLMDSSHCMSFSHTFDTGIWWTVTDFSSTPQRFSGGALDRSADESSLHRPTVPRSSSVNRSHSYRLWHGLSGRLRALLGVGNLSADPNLKAAGTFHCHLLSRRRSCQVREATAGIATWATNTSHIGSSATTIAEYHAYPVVILDNHRQDTANYNYAISIGHLCMNINYINNVR